MQPLDDTEHGVSVDVPLDVARGYRDPAAPEPLRVTCVWGSRDAVAAIPAFGLTSIVTCALAMGAYGVDQTVPGIVWIGVGLLGMTSLGLMYASAALVLDCTVVVMGARELSCAHEPLPWPGSGLVLPVDDLLAFTVEKRVPDLGPVSFDVVASTRRGPITLMRRLTELRSATRVANALSRHLRGVATREASHADRPSRAPAVRAHAAQKFARLWGERT